MSWDSLLAYALVTLALPPGINFVLLIIGFLLQKKLPKVAISLWLFAGISLLVLSLPAIAAGLINSLETAKPLSAEELKALSQSTTGNHAIVVLSAGRIPAAKEYDQIDTVNAATLQRLQYGSWLHKRSEFPVLVSGGSMNNEATAEAVLMNQVMMANFAVAPKWIESQSQSSLQSAHFASLLLAQNGIDEIILVTHANQMQRAKLAFEKQAIKVIEAPTGFYTHPEKRLGWTQYLPSAAALATSSQVINEKLALWWQQISD